MTTNKCHKCGSKINADGLCRDISCPYSEWQQRVELDDLQNMLKAEVLKKYGNDSYTPFSGQ
jgi:hypothetical protein